MPLHITAHVTQPPQPSTSHPSTPLSLSPSHTPCLLINPRGLLFLGGREKRLTDRLKTKRHGRNVNESLCLCACVRPCACTCVTKAAAYLQRASNRSFDLTPKAFSYWFRPSLEESEKQKKNKNVDIQHLHHGIDWIFLLVIFALCAQKI